MYVYMMIVTVISVYILHSMCEAAVDNKSPHSICVQSESEPCNIVDFALGNTTRVDSNDPSTGCIDSSSPYSFVVTKGDPNNVHIHFQGGGICWDQASYDDGNCRVKAQPPRRVGIFDTNNMMNPYANYTTIVILYCSGDMFFGDNATAEFVGPNGESVIQRGTQNALTVLKYVASQQLKGTYLSSPLDKLLVSGSSTGSIAAPLWVGSITSTIQSSSCICLSDSFFLPLAEVYQPALLQSWNICGSILIPEEYSVDCEIRNLSNVDLMRRAISAYPDVLFLLVIAKKDNPATYWYNTYGSYLNDDKPLWPSEYFEIMLPSIEDLNMLPNFLVFLITSLNHLFVSRDRFYTATEYGDEAGVGANRNGTTVSEWLGAYSDDSMNEISSVCEGDNCGQGLIPKTFVFHRKVDTPTSSPTSKMFEQNCMFIGLHRR